MRRLGNWFGIVSCCLKRRHFGIWFDSSWRGRWNVLPIIKEFDTLQLYFIINNKKTLHTASWNLFTHLPSLSVRCSWPSTLCHSYMVFRQQRSSPPKTRIAIMLWVIQYYFPFLARTEFKKGVVNCFKITLHSLHWILNAQQYYHHPNHWRTHSYPLFASHRRRCWMRFHQPKEELLPRIPLLTALSWADPPLFALLSEPPERINRKIRRKVSFRNSCLPLTFQAFMILGTKVSFHLMKLFLSPMRRMIIL